MRFLKYSQKKPDNKIIFITNTENEVKQPDMESNVPQTRDYRSGSYGVPLATSQEANKCYVANWTHTVYGYVIHQQRSQLGSERVLNTLLAINLRVGVRSKRDVDPAEEDDPLPVPLPHVGQTVQGDVVQRSAATPEHKQQHDHISSVSQEPEPEPDANR